MLLCALLLLASCAPSFDDDEEVLQKEEDSPVETSIVPGSRLEDDTYRMITPYRVSEARGLITNQLANRVDIDEMEEGLRRHSTEVFNPKKLYFQEGRYLTTDTVLEWIDELNPNRKDDWDKETHEKNPRIFSHILEQNYLKRTDDNSVQLAGISIGIALKSVYRFEAPKNGDAYSYDIPMNKMLEKGYEVAENVVQSLRKTEGLEKIPIFIALYKEESGSSPVPGNYIQKTVVKGGSTKVENWEKIDEEYVLFPSNEASKKYLKDAEIFNSFGSQIAEFFPNYVGAIGEGYYVNGELQQMTVEIPIEFYGKAEVIGFTQYAYDLVQKTFDSYYDLEINITSRDKVESLLYREAKEEKPTVHIFH